MGMNPYWNWTAAGSKFDPKTNKTMTSLYGNTNIYCPNDSKDETNKYVFTTDATKYVSTSCPYEKVPIAAGVDKKVVEYLWHKMAWDKVRNSRIDIRLFYAPMRSPATLTACRYPPMDLSNATQAAKAPPSFFMYSHISEYAPICYSSEALKMAQSGYLVSIVCVQWADLMICKTRNLSLSQQGMINHFGNFGIFFETALVAILLYSPFLNVALGTRQVAFPHFAVPSFSFYVAIFFYDELRKIWLRNGMVRQDGRLKLTGWIVQNTYY